MFGSLFSAVTLNKRFTCSHLTWLWAFAFLSCLGVNRMTHVFGPSVLDFDTFALLFTYHVYFYLYIKLIAIALAIDTFILCF